MVGCKGNFVFYKGETDVAPPGAAFATIGADRGSWSYLVAAFSACVLEKVLTHNIAWMRTFPMVHELIFVFEIVLKCFACKTLYIFLVYYIITSWH